MDKNILSEYIDSCELIRETEQDIKKLEKKRILTVQGTIKGSNPEFPYQEQHFQYSGPEYGYGDDIRLRQEEKLLEERRKRATDIKVQVEEWLNGIPLRMQRIIRYKFFEGLSWEEVADRMGRKSTGDSVRMELERFIKEK